MVLEVCPIHVGQNTHEGEGFGTFLPQGGPENSCRYRVRKVSGREDA